MLGAMSARSLLLLPLVLAAACSGDSSTLEEHLDDQPGFWFEARPSRADAEHMRTIAESGYASGYVPARETFGVEIHDRERVVPGWNLYSSGHAPEAYLTDLEGETVHRWGLAYENVPDMPAQEHPTQAAWRRVRLRDDGSLLAIYEGLALVCVDRESKLLWAWPRAHHDLDIAPDGRVHVLTRRRRIHPRIDPRVAVLEDFITVLDREGNLLQEVSVYDALLDSSHGRELLDAARSAAPERDGDLLHTNSIQWLDGSLVDRDAGFARDHVLVCFRDLDAVATIDLRRRRVVWFARGDWRAPHDPTLLDGGGLLIFDNMGHAGYSRALEVDAPDVGRVKWSFGGDPPEDFFSVFCGTAQRLPGGNTLVTESCNGRALEVTADGRVVWSFVSPHRAGPGAGLVAALFEVERLPYASTAAWLPWEPSESR